jgi:hypothetical protein
MSDTKFTRPGSGSRPNSSDSAAAIDGERIGPGKSGRHHTYDEDKPASHEATGRERGYDDDRGRGRYDERGRESRDRDRDRERGEESDRGRDSSAERSGKYREDHRLRNDRNEMPSHEATASARMHGHISRGDANDDRYNVSQRPMHPVGTLRSLSHVFIGPFSSHRSINISSFK